MAATSGLCSSASTATLSPWRTLKTPSGSPASVHRRGHPEGRGRVLLAGLEDDGVAGGDRQREEPHRHHGREVERADDADDAERLPDRVHVDAGRDALGVAALEQVRDAAGELHDLEAAGDLAEGVGVHLAVLAGDDRGQLVLAGLEQLAEAEHHAGPGGDRDLAPGVGGPAGGGDDGGGVGLVGQHHPAGHLAGGRIGHVERPIRRSRLLSPSNQWLMVPISAESVVMAPNSAPFRRESERPAHGGGAAAALGGRAAARNERRVETPRPAGGGLDTLAALATRPTTIGSSDHQRPPPTTRRRGRRDSRRTRWSSSREERAAYRDPATGLRWSSSREERAACRDLTARGWRSRYARCARYSTNDHRLLRRPATIGSSDDLAEMRTAAAPGVGERPPFGGCGYEVT